ncbi:oxysterol-binding protein-related protein 1-like isoform X2 [Convolutriloba macropyga]|uniref:oxysterol-binding protein-related protein 1-like isoform X2 n=1 Tax=Convolutriloba macropyga TaxID=536237 RepID=UPI003F526344
MGKSSKKEPVAEDKEQPSSRIVIGEGSPVYEGHRTRLPCQMRDRNPFNILQILKDSIGKDVTRIVMPISINEPLTLIQRFAENLEYVELLQKAADSHNSLDRLKFISAFVVSGLSGILDRISKPFNPILGETFEMIHPNSQTRFIAEQVSHHPPICAFFLDDLKGRFKLTGSCQAKIKFTGRAVTIHVKNLVTLELPEFNETYTYGAVDCIVDNLFIGRPRIEYDGTFTVTNNNTKEYAKFDVYPSSIFTSKKPNEVEGYIYDSENNKKYYIFGFCNSNLSVAPYTEHIQKNRSKLNRQISSNNNPKVSKDKQNRSSSGSEAVFDEIQEENSGENGNISARVQKGENKENSTKPKGSDDDDSKNEDFVDFETLWEVNPRPVWCQDEYCFTSFATILNEITDDISVRKEQGLIPTTDSRFRPDLRMLENGDLDQGAEEKLRLEAKQRECEKERLKSKENWEPLWFKYNSQTKKWDFTNKYWDRNYEKCPDIF